MFRHLELSTMAFALARHSSARLGIIAQNMANADTPGYRRRDLTDFAEAYATETSITLGTFTAPSDLAAGNETASPTEDPDPNGNTVSRETELMNAVRTRQSFDMALTINAATETVLRSTLRHNS